MSISVLQHDVKGATGSNQTITLNGAGSGYDTTGCNLLVVSVSWGGAATVTVSDNKSNTYTALTAATVNSNGNLSQLYYTYGGTFGAGHTVSVQCAGTGVGFQVAAFIACSGAVSPGSPLQSTNTAATGSTSIQPGSLTPGSNGALLVTSLCFNTTTPAIDSSFVITGTTLNDVGGQHVAGGLGYLIQTTAAAVNPTWSWTGGGSFATATMAVFPSVAAPATGYTVTAPSPAYGQEARPATWQATPNGLYSGTITLTPSGAGLTGANAITQTWSSDNSSKSFAFTPSTAGTLTVTPTNNSAFTDPGATTYTSKLITEITPRATIYDTAGNVAQLHQCNLCYDPSTGNYWCLGVDMTGTQTGTGGGAAYAPVGIRAYSSTDLMNWTPYGLVLGTTIGGTSYASGIIERPKLHKHPTNGKFYLFLHVDVDTTMANSKVIVLSNTNPGSNTGWNVEIAATKVGTQNVWDIGTLLDDDGTLYLYFANNNGGSSLYVAPLNTAWNAWGSVTSLTLSTLSLAEGPAPFKYNGYYYLIVSGQNGWSFTADQAYVSTSPLGPFGGMTSQATPDLSTSNKLAYPFTSTGASGYSLSYNSQSSSVFKAPSGQYIYMADYWQTTNTSGAGSLSDTRAVWLPLSIDLGGNVAISWVDQWTPSPNAGAPVPIAPIRSNTYAFIG